MPKATYARFVSAVSSKSVLVHDAVSYMASRADLASAIATAFHAR